MPARAQLIRLMLMEINRVSSHWVALATGGMEMGALTAMTNGLRARERCLDVLRAHHRPAHEPRRSSVPAASPRTCPTAPIEMLRDWITEIRDEINGLRTLVQNQPIWVNRLKDVGWLGVEGCLALGVTGPMLRAAGLPWDLRKTEPYLGLRDVRLRGPDPRRRRLLRPLPGPRRRDVRVGASIVEQAIERLEPGPVWVDDPKIAWPAKLSLGPDGMGNSLEHVQKIMNGSMESLIHHFKLVTEGFRVPPGQAYVVVESPRGELGAHVVSDGGTRPYRVHLREPSFINLQSTAALSIGGMISDVIASVGSIDPVMGGVDR